MTTAVYVLVSGQTDYYYEQLLISACSLRMHNPNMPLLLLVDDNTASTFVGKRTEINKYVSEIRVVETPKEYTPKERSRYIKTTLRKHVSGDLLFIDTDTVITSPLDSIDDTDAEMACVLDYHAPLDKLIEGDSIRQRIGGIFGEDVSDEMYYYNSGVIFMRDTERIHTLFDEWHKFWKLSAFEKGQCYDQPALFMANRKCGHIIKNLDGSYNCQILTSYKFLSSARIIHFFNNYWEAKEEVSPFFDVRLYEQVKTDGKIAPEVKELIKNCKEAFNAPVYFIGTEQIKFLSSIVGTTMYSLYKKKNVSYRFIEALSKLRYRIAILLK